MARDVRPEFDPRQDFLVTRPFKAGGRDFAPGDKFDKALVDTRRLRQMCDLRQVRQVVAEKPPAASKPVKRYRPRAA